MKQTAFILLSAGESLRMGQDKALLDFFSSPWIFEQAWQIKESGLIEALTVVTQPKKVEIFQDILSPLQDADFQIQIVVNADMKSKPSDSLACALNAHAFPEGAFVSPIDVPQNAGTLKVIWQALDKKSEKHIVKPMLGLRGGHPVWLHTKALAKLKESHRLDQFIHSYESKCILELPIDDPRIAMNLNTLSEWENFKAATGPSAHHQR